MLVSLFKPVVVNNDLAACLVQAALISCIPVSHSLAAIGYATEAAVAP